MFLFPSTISMSRDLRPLRSPTTHPLKQSDLQAFPAVEQFVSMQGSSLLCHGYLISLKNFWLTGLWEWNNLYNHHATLVDIFKDLLWTSWFALGSFFSCDHHFNKLMKCFWFLNDTWFDKPGWHRNCSLWKIGLVHTIVSVWARKEK